MNRTARTGRRRSGTPARSGWAATGAAWRLGLIAVGLAGAAINTGNNLLYLICGVVLASLPVSLAASWWNMRAIEIGVSIPRHPRAGVDFAVEIRLHNRRRRGHARGFELQMLVADGRSARAWVERLDAGERLRLVVPLFVERRGPGNIETIGLVTTFPLGLLRRVRRFPRNDAFLVLPAARRSQQHDERLPVPGKGETSPSVPGDEFEGLRRGGDNEDARHVDWKSTARRGVMVVRSTAGEATRGVALDLDTRVDGESEQAYLRFERRVSRLAGAGEVSLLDGGIVRLTVDGTGSQCYAGRPGLIPFLARLARVEPRDTTGRIRDHRPVTRPRVLSPHSLADLIEARQSPPGRAHRFSALAGLAIGFTAVAAYGGVSAPLWFAFVAVVVATILFPVRCVARRDGWMRRGWNVAAVVALLAFGAELAGRGNLLTASLHLIVFITFYQLFNAVTPRDDRLLLLLSVLHLVLASALTTEMSFGLALIAGVLAVVHGQIAFAAMRPDAGVFRPTVFGSPVGRLRYGTIAGAITACLVVIGTLLFFVIPHLGTGTYDLGGRVVQSVAGFSDKASLGDIGRIKLDSTPVMEVELQGTVPAGIDIKWRGAALERFDGRTWRRRDEDAEFVSADAQGRFEFERRSTANRSQRGLLVQHVRLTPDATNTLFAAARAVEVVSRDFPVVRRDGTGALQAPTRGRRRIAYEVSSRVAPRDPARLRAATGDDPSEVLRRNLGLPRLDPRVPELARTIIADAPTRFDAALSIERWLSQRHAYALDVRDRGRDDPLAAFLFDGMAGHCEYFATAMVVLARSSGIPSRLVTGYLRGEKSRFSRRFTVRQSDAHAWVEVFLPGEGWITFDPTPPAGRSSRDRFALAALLFDLHSTAQRWWDDRLIGSDLQDQVSSLLAARDLAVRAASHAEWIVLVAPLAGGWWIVRRRRVAGAALAPVFYRRLQRYLERNGMPQRPDETAEEVARRAAATLPPAAAGRVRRLTELYYRVRFDSRTSESDVDGSARRLLSELERSRAEHVA